MLLIYLRYVYMSMRKNIRLKRHLETVVNYD